MTTKPHPTDAMEMPELTQQQIDGVKEIIAGLAFICEINSTGTLVEHTVVQLSKHYSNQLRAERIKAYDLGRQKALEDAATECDELERLMREGAGGTAEKRLNQAARNIRSMKHEQQ